MKAAHHPTCVSMVTPCPTKQAANMKSARLTRLKSTGLLLSTSMTRPVAGCVREKDCNVKAVEVRDQKFAISKLWFLCFKTEVQKGG
jgi:hypothetical protein